MTINRNEAIAQQSILKVWKEGNFEMIDGMFAPDFVQHHTTDAPDIDGRDAYRRFIESLRNAMPDLTAMTYTTVADGNEVVVHFAITGTHTSGVIRGIGSTNKRLDWEGMILYRFRDEQIVEAWIQYDELGLLRQLGSVSPSNSGENAEEII